MVFGASWAVRSLYFCGVALVLPHKLASGSAISTRFLDSIFREELD